jgi:protein gp37
MPGWIKWNFIVNLHQAALAVPFSGSMPQRLGFVNSGVDERYTLVLTASDR